MKKKPKPRGRWVKLTVYVNVLADGTVVTGGDSALVMRAAARFAEKCYGHPPQAIAVPCVGRYWKKGEAS